MASKVSPIPPGFHTITPSIIVKDGNAAIALYKNAFGAEEIMCMRSPTGGVMHAEMKIGDSVFMLSDEWPDHGMKAPQPKVVNKPSVVPSVRAKPRVVTPEREKEDV